jgi:hypothetical protein
VHGLLFQALRDFSSDRLGEEATQELWAGTAFATDEVYDDALFVEQLGRIAAARGDEPRAVEHDFGAFAGRRVFPSLFPDYYAESADTAAFLLGIEERIHEVVRATLRGAAPPALHVGPLPGLGVIVTYTSHRKLCALLEGLVRGSAAELGDPVDVEQIQCMHEGDPGCVFTVVSTA